MRYESLELRGQQAQQQLAAAGARAAEADSLAERLARMQAEHAALRASSEAVSGSREGELAQLRATAASLRDELADLRSVNEVLRQQATRQPSSALSLQQQMSLGQAAGGGGGGLDGMLERSLSGASSASASASQLAGRQRTASEAGMDALLSSDAGLYAPNWQYRKHAVSYAVARHGCAPCLPACLPVCLPARMPASRAT
jgi:hypothetical protein